MVALLLYILFSIICCVTTTANFLPTILKSKLKNDFQSNSNQTNSKLWMKYLERGLEMINLPLGKSIMINSFLEFYNRNVRHTFSKKIPTNLFKNKF